MKTKLMTLAAASIFVLAITTSCGDKENTGNGANDPTSEYETDKVKHLEGSGENTSDTTRSTVPTSNDTTTQEKTR